MNLPPIQEGRIPFRVPSVDKPCFTFYKVIGDLRSGKPPIVILHGGPGGGHEYCLPLAEIWNLSGLPVIFYDQIGCGASTHLREKDGDTSFWKEDLFELELRNLLDFFKLQDENTVGFHLLGHSWGGCMSSAFAATRPRGLRRLVLISATASMERMMKSIKSLREDLHPDIRQALVDGEESGNLDSVTYNEASAHFSRQHMCRNDPLPQEFSKLFACLAEDRTVFGTMFGPSPLICNGSLARWSVIAQLPRIAASTLVINGEYDTCGDHCIAPFFEHIPRVRWTTLSDAGHFCHLEAGSTRIITLVADFLISGSDSASPGS